jgi:hypothetical protein
MSNLQTPTLVQGSWISSGFSRRHFSDDAATAPAADRQQPEATTAAAAATAKGAAATAGGFRQTCRVGGKEWTFETGQLAGLAHGSCLVSVEGTTVLGTVVVDATPQLEADGVPLQVC